MIICDTQYIAYCIAFQQINMRLGSGFVSCRNVCFGFTVLGHACKVFRYTPRPPTQTLGPTPQAIVQCRCMLYIACDDASGVYKWYDNTCAQGTLGHSAYCILLVRCCLQGAVTQHSHGVVIAWRQLGARHVVWYMTLTTNTLKSTHSKHCPLCSQTHQHIIPSAI